MKKTNIVELWMNLIGITLINKQTNKHTNAHSNHFIYAGQTQIMVLKAREVVNFQGTLRGSTKQAFGILVISHIFRCWSHGYINFV